MTEQEHSAKLIVKHYNTSVVQLLGQTGNDNNPECAKR